MNRNFVKLNDNENHFSIGNLFNIIKNNSKNRTAAIQSEIFCTIFKIDSISDTTVNNYCTGYRAINSEYKQSYIKLKRNYEKDNLAMIDIVIDVVSILDGFIYEKNIDNNIRVKYINSNNNIKMVCNDLYELAKNDYYVSPKLKKRLNELLNLGKLYEFFTESLFFIILEKKQPIYEEEEIGNVIKDMLLKTNISANELKSFLSIELQEGNNFTHSIRKLADFGNTYACYHMANLEYNGEITGKPRYTESFKYYKLAAENNHPAANWKIAYMLINRIIGNGEKEDLKIAWEYLKKANKLDNLAAINTIGICYLNGFVPPSFEKNEKVAITYFKKAILKGYVYAYNNLGKIYENKKMYKKAFEYFKKSAEFGESWAANKVGEYYRQGIGTEKSAERAFYYYSISSEASIKEICNWSKYNLAKYFYENGNAELGIARDLKKVKELLESR